MATDPFKSKPRNPVPGAGAARSRHRAWLVLALAALVALAIMLSAPKDNLVTQPVDEPGQSLAQLQRLSESASRALPGSPDTFAELQDSVTALSGSVRNLESSGLSATHAVAIGRIQILAARVAAHANAILTRQQTLLQTGTALRAIERQSVDLRDAADAVLALKLQQNAPDSETSAARELATMAPRIGKSASEFLSPEGLSPEAVFLLGKDLKSFKDLAEGLLNGNPDLRLTPARDEQTHERLIALRVLYGDMRAQADIPLGDNLQALVLVREAQVAIVAGSALLRQELEALPTRLSRPAKGAWAAWQIAGLAAALLSAVWAIHGLATTRLTRRAAMAAAQSTASFTAPGFPGIGA